MRKAVLMAVLSASALFAGCAHPQPVIYAAAPPPPPALFSAIAQQGYHAGIEAARRDIAAVKAPNVKRHPYFRRPPVAPELVADYRHGFREGYRAVYRSGTPPPPPGN